MLALLAGAWSVRAAAQGDAVPPGLSHLSPQERARHDALWSQVMARFPFERVVVPGQSALAAWENATSASGALPVIVGSDHDLQQIASQFSIDDPPGGAGVQAPRSVETILAAAALLRFPEDLSRWPGGYREEDLRAPEGSWPEMEAAGAAPGLTIATDLSNGRPFDRVTILRIPARENCEIPAYLRWGGWNACPPPEYHVAALRSLNRRYGAKLIGINGDTMNLRVDRRPSSRVEALALARTLYRYCPDIVDQGTGNLSALAAGLLASNWWFFWWD